MAFLQVQGKATLDWAIIQLADNVASKVGGFGYIGMSGSKEEEGLADIAPSSELAKVLFR